jgi:hypothetical protein
MKTRKTKKIKKDKKPRLSLASTASTGVLVYIASTFVVFRDPYLMAQPAVIRYLICIGVSLLTAAFELFRTIRKRNKEYASGKVSNASQEAEPRRLFDFKKNR